MIAAMDVIQEQMPNFCLLHPTRAYFLETIWNKNLQPDLTKPTS